MILSEEQEKWLAALESGKYAQTKHYLHDDAGYCCLGVACEVLGYEWVEGNEKWFRIKGLNSYEVLPDEICKRLGLRDASGSAIKPHDELTTLNDERGKTFKEIAAMIRANPEAYFVSSNTEPSSSNNEH